jgi:hypothetical protein
MDVLYVTFASPFVHAPFSGVEILQIARSKAKTLRDNVLTPRPNDMYGRAPKGGPVPMSAASCGRWVEIGVRDALEFGGIR